jgi:hypothetical protein
MRIVLGGAILVMPNGLGLLTLIEDGSGRRVLCGTTAVLATGDRAVSRGSTMPS